MERLKRMVSKISNRSSLITSVTFRRYPIAETGFRYVGYAETANVHTVRPPETKMSTPKNVRPKHIFAPHL